MKQTGFTLVELLVTVALIGIVAAFAVPSFSNTIRDHQLRTTASDYYALIRYARSEALRSGRPVTVEPVDGDWSKGLIATNQAGDALREIRSSGSLNITEKNTLTALVFNGKGYLATAVEFKVCDNRTAESARRIDILTSGFAAVTAIQGC